MTYPQKPASGAVQSGQEYFRLFTELESSGDIFELDESIKAFIIGPQSDIGRVRVTYYDPNQSLKINSFVVSVDDPFIGRVDKLTSTKYPQVNEDADILVSLEDLLNNDYNPTGTTPGDAITFVKPRIDLLCYFDQPNDFPQKRADFTKRGNLTIPDTGAGSGAAYLIVPFYRRKVATFKFLAFPAHDYDFVLNGLTWIPGAGTGPSDSFMINQLQVSLAGIKGNTTGQPPFIYKASTLGLFDYLQVTIVGTATDGAAGPSIFYDIELQDEEL